ncbi:hypothetical protein HanXRQr2_Chr09g0379611 [Helianthus annuus]|uniref:Uncharacterized protein n=1 Tax=Helianthus annuus TaxID=4232 RepID=A0A9K3I482_HELAN|nr:hypothetical protein HanXRQr2_Chr09g0379611 [Helianthus annuus]
MFVVRAEITSFKVRVEELKKSKVDYKDNYEEAKFHHERVKVLKKLKDETVEEARKVNQAALNVAQENYAEVQSIVEPLITDLGWMQHSGIANSILNAMELDKVVVARAAGHRARYVECVAHVEEALHQQFGTHHCSVSDGAEEGSIKAEENYDNLSLPIWT